MPCKKYDYVLSWKNREVIVVVNIFVQLGAKYNMLYYAESLVYVMLLK